MHLDPVQQLLEYLGHGLGVLILLGFNVGVGRLFHESLFWAIRPEDFILLEGVDKLVSPI